jgi:hypothetical protein
MTTLDTVVLSLVLINALIFFWLTWLIVRQ